MFLFHTSSVAGINLFTDTFIRTYKYHKYQFHTRKHEKVLCLSQTEHKASDTVINCTTKGMFKLINCVHTHTAPKIPPQNVP